MKKIFFLVFVFLFINSVNGQSDKWSTVTYKYSSGPVSPEYQYNYTIIIHRSGDGILSYTKSAATTEHNFRISRKRLNKLKGALKKSKVFTVSMDHMKSDRNLIGGPIRKAVITMWQAPDLDSKPATIEIPSQVNETYSANITKLYDLIEDLVPGSVWAKAIP